MDRIKKTYESEENGVTYVIEEWESGGIVKKIKPVTQDGAATAPSGNKTVVTTKEVADSILSTITEEYANKVIDSYTLQLMEEGVI